VRPVEPLQEDALAFVAESLLDGRVQLGVIVLHGQDVIALGLDDLPGDSLLAAHCIDRDDGAFHVDPVNQLWNHRDFDLASVATWPSDRPWPVAQALTR